MKGHVGQTIDSMITALKRPFRASGVNHSSGMVPDPGRIGGTSRVLREDAQWAAVVGPTAVPATSVVSETSFDQAPSVGTSPNYARADHTHGSPPEPTGGGGGGGSVDGLIVGVTVVYNSAASVDMLPSGADGVASLSLWNGTVFQLFTTSATKTASLASSGANGLDTGSEAASTFYHLWAIGKADGTLALLLSLSASAPTMPTGYTFKGLIGGVSNDGSSNIVEFVQLSDGRFMFTGTQVDSVRGINVLSGGVSLSYDPVNLTKAIPDIPGCAYGLEIRAANGGTNSVFSCSEDSAGNTLIIPSRTIGITGAVTSAEHWEIDCRNTGSRAASLYYKWTVLGGLDTDMWIKWFDLGGISSGGSGGGGGGSVSPATTVVSEMSFGQATVVGTSALYARADHSHGTPADPSVSPATTVVTETSFGLSSAVGSSALYARADHTHGTPADPGSGGGGAVDATGVFGVKLTRNTAAQLQLVPSGDDGKARIGMWNGSAWKSFTVTTTQTADITVAGANGLDTGAEAASTFYHLWAIGKADGTFGLLLSLSSSSPTMPSGYTYRRLIGGDANDGSSNLVPFHHERSGWVRYKNSGAIGYGGINVLPGGTATTPTAIDLTKAIPDVIGADYEILSDPSCTGTTGTRVDYFFSSTTTDHLDAATVASTANWLSEIRTRFVGTVHAARNAILYYAWAAATAGRSIDTIVTAWNIGIGWGGGAGGGGGVPNFSDDETITGAINGSNNAFTLAHTPNPASSLQFYRNGILLKSGTGYTISGAVVTTLTGYTPSTGAVLSASFRY